MNGRLKINLDGGGHALGIQERGQGAKLYLIPEFNKEEIYCEEGVVNTLNFTLINVGGSPSGPVHIRADTPKSFLTFNKDTLTLGSLGTRSTG